MPAALLVTAADPELPAILADTVPRATFTTEAHLRAVLPIKPGAMVLVLDESQVSLVSGLRRVDVRALVLVTPQRVPVVFRPPIIAVVERPLVPSAVLAALQKVMGELGARGAQDSRRGP